MRSGAYVCFGGVLKCFRFQDTTWQEQYDLGMQYLTEGDYEAAVVAFTAAIDIDAKDVQAYTGLIQAYIGTGDYEAAVSAAGQGAEALADSDQVQADGAVGEFASTLMDLGELCQEEGDYGSAETIYSLIIGIDDNLVDAYIARAEIYLLLGEQEKALEDYRKALELLRQGETGSITEDALENLIEELESPDEDFFSDESGESKEYFLEEKYILEDGVITLLQRYTYYASGSVQTYTEYDSDGNLSVYEEYTYDEYDFLLTIVAEHYRDSSVVYQEIKSYENGRLIRKEYGYTSDESLDYSIDYVYDADGNLIRETWINNSIEDKIVDYRYIDGLLAESEVTNYTYWGYVSAGITYYTYDNEGNVLSIMQGGENDSSHVLMEYTYDEDGNVLTESESMDIGKDYITKDWECVYVYDQDGQLVEKYFYTFAYGEPGEEEIDSTDITEYTYENGKLLREVKYSYHADGTLYDNGIYYTEYAYDEKGNLMQSVYLDSDYTELYRYEYTYVSINITD